MIELKLERARLLDGSLVDLYVDGGRFVSSGEPRVRSTARGDS